jgi:hypothetical protein
MGKEIVRNISYSKFHKTRDAVLLLFVNFASHWAFRNAQENQLWLKLTGAYQLLICDDDKNLLGDNIDRYLKEAWISG